MRQILSILLILIFFAGNVGFTVATHYCGGKVYKQEISLNGSDVSCGMEVCSKESNGHEFSQYCCEDQIQNYKITDKFNSPASKKVLNPEFNIAFILTYFSGENYNNSENYSEYLYYHPPLPDRDITVLFQSFLI